MEFQKIRVRVRIFVEPDDTGFHAFCPELKGLHVDGKTEEEAFDNAREAAMAYLTSLIKHNDPLPVGSQETAYTLGGLIKSATSSWFGKSHARIEEFSLAA